MHVLPLLSAKLFPPPHRAELVPRLRLAEKFEAGLRVGHKTTLICAPAGFGKTTLVVEWLERTRAEGQQTCERRFAWLSLEPTDNDRAVFLRYLLAALQTVQPGVGSAVQALAETGKLPNDNNQLLLPLLNDLREIDRPFFLVLDDYHTIQDPAIHETMAVVLEHQPPNMHTIITTRQDPLLPLARWRARGLLTDFRLGELRFNRDEAAEFLLRTMALPLTAADIDALGARTEGWIAGLQMAAISLQQLEANGDATASDFIQIFTGDDRFIMDYLVDEVLSHQPQTVQEFLLHTAVLERFHAGLCAVVLDQPESDSAEQLTYLERSNLFLIPLDNRRQWFRYHHLFAELLRYRLSNAYGSEYVSTLRVRASRWCSENGLPEQAIAYAQAAQDWSLCAELVMQHNPAMLRRGEFATVERWMRVLPDVIIRRNPILCRDYGDALTHLGQLNKGIVYLRLAEEGFANDPDALGRTLVYAANNALMRGEFAEQIRLARRSLELIDPQNTWMRGVASFYLGLGLLHNGDPYHAEIVLREALSQGQQAENPRTCINALTQLGRISVLRLEFQNAEILFRRAVAYQIDGHPYPGCDVGFLDLAMLKYFQNDLETAMEAVRQGLEVNRRSGSAEMLAYGWRLAAQLHQLAGRTAEAEDYFEKANQLSASFDLSPLTLSLNAALQVEMALTAGDIARAEQAAPRVTNSLGVYPFIFYPEVVRVQLLLLQKRKTEALRLLEPAMELASKPGWEFPRLQVRLLQALAAAGTPEACSYLETALQLALPASASRSFLDLGEPMRRLLAETMPQISEPALRQEAARLLGLFPSPKGESVPGPTGNRVHATDLVEPLSEREIEVLRLIADGLSNAEIAQQLYLSPNTLKAHTQNIYTKLDVHSRLQAVNKARELAIL